MKKLLFKNGYIVPIFMEPFDGDILVENGKIKELGKNITSNDTEVINCEGKVVLPGLIQAHIHLAQVLFRGMAEDMKLLEWLDKRIYKLESAHTEESMYWSAMLGIIELIRCGTTGIVDIGCAKYPEAIVFAMRESGIRGYTGRMLLDVENVPQELSGKTDKVIYEAVELIERYHLKGDKRIGILFAPRFSLACSDELLKLLPSLAEKYDTILQTHAAETTEENDYTLKTKSSTNIEYLYAMGFLTDRTSLVHAIWVTDKEMKLIKETETSVVTCPSTNLKLSSGIAPIEEYKRCGINVGLGADGAPCNNMLDIFNEMRLACLLQKVKYGPKALPAVEVIRFATINGAKILRMPVGTLEPGKDADIVLLSIDDKPYANPKFGVDIFTRLVYETKASDVTDVFVMGNQLLKDGNITFIDEQLVIEKANIEAKKLLDRSGVG